jgi:FHS family glucose/mannose:H+ symporter-like MFS transporter
VNHPPRLLSAVILYLGFAATGVGLALPGSVLPALLTQWSLADSQAGLLFLLGWMGSSIGALLVRGSLVWSLGRGAFLLTAACFGMAYASRWSCFPWMTLFGIGLGMTMTATSLIQASRNAERRGVELNRMNLVWAIGATLCPTLATHSLRIANVRGIFSAVGIFFAFQLLWIAIFERDWPHQINPAATPQTPPTKRMQWKLNLRLWPLSLVILIFLPTGIESAIGGWAATYVQRTQETISTTVTAGTCFWVGVLLSRTLSSTVLLLKRSELFVLRQSLFCVALGTLLLLVTTSAFGILPAVFLIGFGLGPVYPLLLALALQYSEDSLIFFVAGVGSAFLPWLTGVVSGSTKSLHTGLFVPFAGALLMLILGLRLASRDHKQPLYHL